MKSISFVKYMELLASLKERYTDLLEDKNYMMSNCEFDCCEDEFEYDCICDELEETEQAIDKLYDLLYAEGTIVTDDIIYYTDDEGFC